MGESPATPAAAAPVRRGSGWLRWQGARPDARLTLLCLPYAGGSPLAYSGWSRALPSEVAVGVIALPGRLPRRREPPIDDLDALVAEIASAVAAHLERPYALFGHSMGALVAFELARELRRRGAPPPRRLMVSSLRAPQLAPVEPPAHALPDDELIERLRALQGTPEHVLADAELLRLFLPAVRADLRACETWQYRDEPPLAVPIDAFGGRDDPQVDEPGLRAWARQTSAGFRARLFDGGHFYLLDARGPLLREVAAALAAEAGT